MPRSMTGYGRAEAILDGIRVIVEIRSVNHRYSDIVVRMPRYLLVLEDAVRKTIGEQVLRGRVEVGITFDRSLGAQKTVFVDTALANDYFESLSEVSRTLGLSGDITISDLVGLPDVLMGMSQ